MLTLVGLVMGKEGLFVLTSLLYCSIFFIRSFFALVRSLSVSSPKSISWRDMWFGAFFAEARILSLCPGALKCAS